MNEAAELQRPELSDDQVTALIADPALIETHEVALEVLAVLDAEIANIQTQLDAAAMEANIRPLPPDRQAWMRRASYAGAMRRNERHKVMQRDKELRGMKGRAFTEPSKSKEEKVIKQQRLLTEAEDRRLKRHLAIEHEKTRQMEIAQQRREKDDARSFRYRFLEAARRVLPEETFRQIEDEAATEHVGSIPAR